MPARFYIFIRYCNRRNRGKHQRGNYKMYNMHKNNKKLKRGLALFIAIILIVTTLLM